MGLAVAATGRVDVPRESGAPSRGACRRRRAPTGFTTLASSQHPAIARSVTPFAPPGVFYDTSMADGEGVEHTTSWLTINPVKGCSVGCTYCFRVRWGASDQPVAAGSVDTLVDELIAHPAFVAHETPVSVNVSSTDSMLPTVRETTFRALELFEQRGLRNPFGLTTKLHIDNRFTARLAGLRHVRPIVFVSLAFLPWKAEPVPTRHRIANLRRLSTAGVPVVLYFRPIVEGWNDSDEILERAFRLGDQHCNAICVGGLRLSAEITANLASHGVLPRGLTSLGFHDKQLPAPLRQRIDALHRKLDLTVPIYDHTSCAVSRIIGIANYNELYRDPTRNCSSSCPRSQQVLCGR